MTRRQNAPDATGDLWVERVVLVNSVPWVGDGGVSGISLSEESLVDERNKEVAGSGGDGGIVGETIDTAIRTSWIRRIRHIGYGVPDLLGTAYRAPPVRCIGVLGYGVLYIMGTAYWLFGYEELAENVLLMVFDQSIIYGVSAGMDTAYSSKSGNGLESFKVIRYGVCF
ncbi:hypothetical protein Tco_0261248 [Tanacetum coccineum]